MPDQMFVVVRRDTGEAVAFGDFVQDARHCICSHAEHPQGSEDGVRPDGTPYTRPLGCHVEGCWHNYDVPTKGVEVKRHADGAPDHGVVLWSDPDGLADCAFVSDPLSPELEAIPIDRQLVEGERWDAQKRAIVAITNDNVIAVLKAKRAALDAEIAKIDLLS